MCCGWYFNASPISRCLAIGRQTDHAAKRGAMADYVTRHGLIAHFGRLGNEIVTNFDLAQLETAFSAATALATSDAREAYLQELASQNLPLATEVRKLLASNQRANHFFEAPHNQRLRMLMTTLGNPSLVVENEVDEFLRQSLPPHLPHELARLSDHFALLELVAVGSTGFLFRGFDCHLNRPVAIKALAPSVARDARQKSAFIDEARLASRIKHPNVVTIYHVEPGSVDRPNAFIAMEWIDGHNLQERLDADPSALRIQAGRILSQLTAGIAAIHAQGIVHRDIKPGNLLLETGTGRVVIVDFGLAFESNVSEALFLPAGTPLYMSPEQVSGEKPTDRSDQFSLALVAFQCLTGQHPFVTQSIPELLEHIKQAKWSQEPTAYGLSPPALQVFRQALSPQPSERYPSVDKFYHELQPVIGGLPDLTTGSPPPPSALHSQIASSDTRETRRGQNWAGVASIALAAIFVATLLTTYAWRAWTPPTEAEGRASSQPVPTDPLTDSSSAATLSPLKWLDERTCVNRVAIEFTKVPAPSDSIIDGKRAEFANHPEYTDGIDWRNWTRPFLISSEPITFRQCIAVMKQPPVTVRLANLSYDLDAPVTNLYRREMQQFCDELNRLEGHGDSGYRIAELQEWSFATYGAAMLVAPDQAAEIEAAVLGRSIALTETPTVPANSATESTKATDSNGRAAEPPAWAKNLFLRLPMGDYWEFTATQKPTLQQLDGVLSLHEWGQRRNAEEHVLVGRPNEDLFLHWFDLNNGCNDFFVGLENLKPLTETDGETSYLRPIEQGTPGTVTYRYQTAEPIVAAEVKAGLYLYHPSDEGGVRIRGRRTESDSPLAEQPWRDVLQVTGVYDKEIRTDISDFVRGMREFEIQYWVVNHSEPRHYAQIFRGLLLKRDNRYLPCFVSLTTAGPQASVRSTGPIPEHFMDPRVTFRISYSLNE